MDLNSYLDRIGAARPATLDIAALRELHLRHLHAVPFENLSIHLDEPIDLTEQALLDKIVRRRRGGFCYELNGAFAHLLRGLGFDVTLLSAKVVQPDGRVGPPFDHLALRVELDEPWLVDVGFGRNSLYPLRLNATEPQADPAGEFLVVDTPGGDLELRRDGTPAYILERRGRALEDFVPTAWWQSTSPDSPFTKGPSCSVFTPSGRLTLAGNRLIETVDGVRSEHELADDEAIRHAYREHFGFTLDRLPGAGRKGD